MPRNATQWTLCIVLVMTLSGCIWDKPQPPDTVNYTIRWLDATQIEVYRQYAVNYTADELRHIDPALVGWFETARQEGSIVIALRTSVTNVTAYPTGTIRLEESYFGAGMTGPRDI